MSLIKTKIKAPEILMKTLQKIKPRFLHNWSLWKNEFLLYWMSYSIMRSNHREW